MSDTRFEDVNTFWQFENEVARRSRYVRSARAARFLDAVVATCPKRLSTISQGTVFWRAQIGHRWTDEVDAGQRNPLPHPEARMKPWDDRAYEGRVNPKGISSLYFATDREAAMSEVRPGIGSIVSVARFEAIRDLVVVDCSRFAQPFDGKHAELMSDDVENQVWSHIDYAFSRPVVRSDNTAGYAATQILAEVFKTEGYDGIIYKRHFRTMATTLRSLISIVRHFWTRRFSVSVKFNSNSRKHHSCKPLGVGEAIIIYQETNL